MLSNLTAVRASVRHGFVVGYNPSNYQRQGRSGGIAEVEGAYFDRTATVRSGGRPAAVLRYQNFYDNDVGGERGLQIQLPGPASGARYSDYYVGRR